MSLLEKTKHLLRINRITPNKLLGQNFLVDESVFQKLVENADLNLADVVLDVGAGFGFLTKFIAAKCGYVLAVEKDHLIASALREQLRQENNVCVIEGDVLNIDLPFFEKVVSAPPYKISSALLKWLFESRFKCAVLILQDEFANRLVAQPGTEDYGWMTVYSYYHAMVKLLDRLPRYMFYPEPAVDSVIVQLVPHRQPPFKVNDLELFSQMLKTVFAERNKKVLNAALLFAKNILNMSNEDAKFRLSNLLSCEKRVRTLAPEAFGELIDALTL